MPISPITTLLNFILKSSTPLASFPFWSLRVIPKLTESYLVFRPDGSCFKSDPVVRKWFAVSYLSSSENCGSGLIRVSLVSGGKAQLIIFLI